MSADTVALSGAQVAQFEREGYLVLHDAIDPALLAGMQAECERNLALQLRDMDRAGTDTLGLTQRDRRYFLPDRFEDSAALCAFLFGARVDAIAAALLGRDAYLLLDLFVVKSQDGGTPFAWHQDGGYLTGMPHRRYITLWCALDDMSEANGTLRVLPYARAASRAVVPHVKDRASHDLVGYAGDDPGDVVTVAAGSIVVLASDLFHCSGGNQTGAPRRAYVASLTAEPVLNEHGLPWNFAVPIRRDGAPVTAPAA